VGLFSYEILKISHSDALKEFEKEIQEDLQEVDNRLEEEEVRLTTSLHYFHPMPCTYLFCTANFSELCVCVVD
jgi:hypothetical protein